MSSPMIPHIEQRKVLKVAGDQGLFLQINFDQSLKVFLCKQLALCIARRTMNMEFFSSTEELLGSHPDFFDSAIVYQWIDETID